jgi:hypothetical protein
MTSIDKVTNRKSVLTPMGVSGKTITDVIVHQHGSVIAIEVLYAGGSQFVKFKQGVIEAGGTLDFGTGTIV